jgi:hypothetical protein
MDEMARFMEQMRGVLRDLGTNDFEVVEGFIKAWFFELEDILQYIIRTKVTSPSHLDLTITPRKSIYRTISHCSAAPRQR